MSTRIRKERKAYYDILERTQSGDLDVMPWLIWFLDYLERAIEQAAAAVQAVLAKTRFWQVLTGTGVSVNERQRQLLNKLLDGFEGKLTTSKWATIAKCSQDTAYRDILHLVEKGALVKDDAGGRATSYSLRIR